jgi:hypothetical protein
LGVLGACFYVSFGYCAVWKQHASAVLVLWAITFAFDFLLMEVGLELLIMLLCIWRKFKPMRMILNLFVTIKSLRNYH